MSFLSVPPGNETPDPQTWYLLVELNGISTILVYLSLISFTEPQHTSMHFTKAQTLLGLCFVPFPGPSSSGNQVLGKRSRP